MTDNEPTHDPADTTIFNEDQKNQTLRISLDDARPIKSPLESKKATSRISDIPAHMGPIPQTIRLKRPPTSPITVQPVDVPPPAKKPGDTALVQAPTTVRPVSADTVKRQTSRIGPESAAPRSPADLKRATGPILGIPMHAGPIPQTIRLKRPATSPMKRPPTAPIVTRSSEPSVTPGARVGQDITEAPTVIKQAVSPKVPTSRIVLEDHPAPATVIAKQPTTDIPPLTSGEPPAPKTIRLKRPSSLSDAEETAQVTAVEGLQRSAKKGETSKIDLPVEDSALTPITQRKTIKIKRTDRTITPPRAATPEAAAAQEHVFRAEAPAPEAEPMLVFPLVTLAATLCIAALVYIMAAQAFGVHLLLPSSMQLH